MKTSSLAVLIEYCNNVGLEGEKDRKKQVVTGFWFREGPTTTRLEGLVVRNVVSCLGVNLVVGMEDCSYGSRDWSKRGHMREIRRNVVV